MPELRFYGVLNRFLAPARRGRSFVVAAAAHDTVKHLIESAGVPHTEVALVLVDGEPARLEHRLQDVPARIAVYPRFHGIDLGDGAIAAPPPLPLRFAADAHLGRLARLLRFVGWDTVLAGAGSDAALVALALAERRVVLTRDRALLMHRDVEHGCFVHAIEPLAQLRELADRLALTLTEHTRTSRCMLCNVAVERVPKAVVLHRLPPRTAACFDEFWRCPACDRLYWRGSHWGRMQRQLGAVASAGLSIARQGQPPHLQ